jgi:hypothetical protein
VIWASLRNLHLRPCTSVSGTIAERMSLSRRKSWRDGSKRALQHGPPKGRRKWMTWPPRGRFGLVFRGRLSAKPVGGLVIYDGDGLLRV